MGSEDGPNAKRAEVERAKKQRLERISAEYMSMVRSVNISDYMRSLPWTTMKMMLRRMMILILSTHGRLVFTGVLEELWYGGDATIQPSDPLKWIDRTTDQVKIERLCEMGCFAA